MTGGPGRSPEVEPFLRGCAWRGVPGVPYPRFDPRDAVRGFPPTPGSARQIPAGVRLELVGDAAALELDYATATDDLGYRGDGAGTTFALWRDGKQVDEQPALLGAGTVTLALRGRARGAPRCARRGVPPRGHATRGPGPASPGGVDRARTGRPPVGGVRRLAARGVGGERTRPGLGGGGGPSTRPRPSQSRVCGLGARRDPVRRGGGRTGGRRHLDHAWDQLPGRGPRTARA